MDKIYKKQKVNVILDTNIWLYLSNGYEQLTNSFTNTNFHFELLRQLKSKQENEEITILVTEVIIKEWARNKHHAEALIQRRKNRITDIQNKFEVFKKKHP